MSYYKYDKGQTVFASVGACCAKVGTRGKVVGRRKGPEYLVKFKGKSNPVACVQGELDARQFVLSRKEYGKMYALAAWTRDVPDWIELGDYAWEQIECYWQETLQSQLAPEEIVRVEMEGASLVAYVWPYEQGHKETRVPVLERGTV